MRVRDMTFWSGTARVAENGCLLRKEKAGETLQLQPGEEVEIVLIRQAKGEAEETETDMETGSSLTEPQRAQLVRLLRQRYININPRLLPPRKR